MSALAAMCIVLGATGGLRLASVMGAAGIAGVVGATSLLPSEAHAHVPRADRVIDAIAAANVSGRRVSALRYQLELRIGDGPPVATGDLVSHPTGLARLELRASGGLIERHILLGDQHSAARNARVLVRPRAFLPPLFVLQSNSGVVLEAALGTLGVDRNLMGLAPCGDSDCYVIGDPTRAVRRPNMAVVLDAESTDDDPDASGETGAENDADTNSGRGDGELKIVFTEPAGESESSEETASEEQDEVEEAVPHFASLWVDTADYRVRQIESRDGVRIVLGPYVSFERLSVPQWWSIEEPGKRTVRFEVEGVVEVNAPAAAFSKTWLMSPVEGSSPEDAAPDPSTPVPADTSALSDPAPGWSGTRRNAPVL